jgi:hypothetical protein
VPIHRTLAQAVSLDHHAQDRSHSILTLVEYCAQTRQAAAAAAAARMHLYLLQHQMALSAENLMQYASELGLDPRRFERHRTSVDIAARIGRDLISGHRSAVRRTPHSL